MALFIFRCRTAGRVLMRVPMDSAAFVVGTNEIAKLTSLHGCGGVCMAYSTQRTQSDLDEEDEVLKRQILNAALKHVNSKGWSMDAIKTGATDVNLTEAISNVFTEFDLVKHFISECNDALEHHLRDNQLKLRDAVEWRLQKVAPYVPRFSEALAFATHPKNLPHSAQLLQNLADSIAHHSLQDKSTDLTWYARRAGIASIYVTSELHLIQDDSPNFEQTWKFLDRRVQDFENMRKGSLIQLPAAVPELASIGMTTLLNMLGRNKQR